MSLENALDNLRELAETLEVQPPKLDEELSCCLECPDGLNLHFMYDQESDHLYVYMPLLQGLPKTVEGKANLYEMLLECSLEFARAHYGTIGIDKGSDCLMFYEQIDMNNQDKEKLITSLPQFMDMAIFWRDLIARVA